MRQFLPSAMVITLSAFIIPLVSVTHGVVSGIAHAWEIPTQLKESQQMHVLGAAPGDPISTMAPG